MRAYFIFLFVLIAAFFILRFQDIAESISELHWVILMAAITFYLCAHLFRIMRLILLTLDEREKAFPLARAHSLTAFTSSFLPYKIGELLRLGAIYHVYGNQKALAIWLVERISDILILMALIFFLYLLKVEVPTAMQSLLIIFAFFSIFGLLTLFSISKIFSYLNRRLILSSLSTRGLTLLKAGHLIHQLELEILKSVEGRVLAILFLTTLVWTFEVIAISLFIGGASRGEFYFANIFTSGLLVSLPGGANDITNSFALYQSMVLVLLAVPFLITPIFKRIQYLRF